MSKIIITAILLISLSGCASYRLSHAHGTVNGNNLATPYGPANGQLEYDSWMCFGKCPAIINKEVLTNATRE